MEKGSIVRCVNAQVMPGRKIGPPLVLNQQYEVKEVLVDKQGYEHVDVGLLSEHNYITCFETGEELERGDRVHWCHKSRFEVVS